MCRRVLGDSVAACLHPCWFNIIKLQACGGGVPEALIEFPKDSVDSRRSPPYNYKDYQDKLYPRGVRTRALRLGGDGGGGPQANLVNLFVTAWRGQALTKSFNKMPRPDLDRGRHASARAGPGETCLAQGYTKGDTPWPRLGHVRHAAAKPGPAETCRCQSWPRQPRPA